MRWVRRNREKSALSQFHPARRDPKQRRRRTAYACFTTQVIIQRQDISLSFSAPPPCFVPMLPFKQRANNIHFPEAEQKGRMLKLKLKQLFGFFAFGAPARSVLFRRSVCLSVLPPVQRSLNSTAYDVAYSQSRGTTAVPSLPCDGSGSFSSSHHVRSSPSVRLRSPPLAVSTSPLPKPRPAGSLSFSPLQLYCILHAPNLKGKSLR